MLSDRDFFFQNIGQTSKYPLLLEINKASGIYLYSTNGKKYIDLLSGFSVNNIGHNNEKVKKAIIKQLDNYTHLTVYGSYIQSPQIKLSKKLLSILNDDYDNVYFLNSGSESVELALKLARKKTQRTEIISFNGAYHGSTCGALSIMGNEKLKSPFYPLLPDTKTINFNSEADLEQITENTACVVVEAIQAEAGIITPKNNYLQKLEKRCNEQGCLLIVDEIQTGIGRTGKWFAFSHYGIKPDIICSAKALGGGLPLAAVITSKEIMQVLVSKPSLGHMTTFGGNPISCVASLAAIEFIEENSLIEKSSNIAKFFVKELMKIKNIKRVGGKGLFLSVEINDNFDINTVMEKLTEEGIITSNFLFNLTTFRIIPPLIINFDEAEFIIEKIKKVLC